MLRREDEEFRFGVGRIYKGRGGKLVKVCKMDEGGP
jgi:hypothetical protein